MLPLVSFLCKARVLKPCSGIPAGHFGWDFLKQLQAQPTYNCTSAHSTYPFSNYQGGLSYTDLSNKTLYIAGPTNSTYGYYPQACTTANTYICEVPQSTWRCPPSPPAPPPAPVSCLPQDNELQMCNVTRGSCYRYKTGGAAITTHRTACTGWGGYLVAWNSYEEQLEVENYFTGGAARGLATNVSQRCRVASLPCCHGWGWDWLKDKETHFAGTGKLWHYWMGIENTTAGWRWPDGTLTTGYVSNANPYSHWYNNFQTTWTVTDCIFGHLSYPYSK